MLRPPKRGRFQYRCLGIKLKKKARFYRNIIDYVQLVFTAIAVFYAIFMVFKLLRNCVFTKLPFCCRYCKKDSKYTVVPRLAGKSFKPNSKTRNLFNDEYVKAQPSAPNYAKINPV